MAAQDVPNRGLATRVVGVDVPEAAREASSHPAPASPYAMVSRFSSFGPSPAAALALLGPRALPKFLKYHLPTLDRWLGPANPSPLERLCLLQNSNTRVTPLPNLLPNQFLILLLSNL